MSRVMAGITISVDGYVAGPNDGPGCGLGEGGERLHYWVFGGPWTYDAEPQGDSKPADEGWLEEGMSGLGAIVGGRATYEAAGHWGDENPFGVPFFIVTHRPEEQPDGGHFRFRGDLLEAVVEAQSVAGEKNVHVMGGADVIRQALAAGVVDELSIIVAPVVLGGGKRLFDGFEQSVELEHKGIRQSRYATFIDYRVRRG